MTATTGVTRLSYTFSCGLPVGDDLSAATGGTTTWSYDDQNRPTQGSGLFIGATKAENVLAFVDNGHHQLSQGATTR